MRYNLDKRNQCRDLYVKGNSYDEVLRQIRIDWGPDTPIPNKRTLQDWCAKYQWNEQRTEYAKKLQVEATQKGTADDLNLNSLAGNISFISGLIVGLNNDLRSECPPKLSDRLKIHDAINKYTKQLTMLRGWNNRSINPEQLVYIFFEAMEEFTALRNWLNAKDNKRRLLSKITLRVKEL